MLHKKLELKDHLQVTNVVIYVVSKISLYLLFNLQIGVWRGLTIESKSCFATFEIPFYIISNKLGLLNGFKIIKKSLGQAILFW